MKKIIVLTAIPLLLLAFTANAESDGKSNQKQEVRVEVKASENYITRNYPELTGFEAIESNSMADIVFVQSPDFKSCIVSASGADNVIEYLEFSVNDRTLTVDIKDNIAINGDAKLKVHVTAPWLKSAIINGSGDLEIPGNLWGNCMEIHFKTTGSGDVKCAAVICEGFVVMLSGSGDVKCDVVTCGILHMSSRGSGDVEMNNISSRQLEVSVDGSGDMKLVGRTTVASLMLNGSGDIDAEGLYADAVSPWGNGSGQIKIGGQILKND